jgi:hypothetical protein
MTLLHFTQKRVETIKEAPARLDRATEVFGTHNLPRFPGTHAT